jgi:hypothetical protein
VVVFLRRCWRDHPDGNHTTYHNSHHPSSHTVLPSRTRFDETPGLRPRRETPASSPHGCAASTYSTSPAIS